MSGGRRNSAGFTAMDWQEWRASDRSGLQRAGKVGSGAASSRLEGPERRALHRAAQVLCGWKRMGLEVKGSHRQGRSGMQYIGCERFGADRS